MRILYVEDNKANLMLVERVAKMGGHEVVNRTKGETAVADFDTIQPDMVLMDIQLEGEMTGLEAVIKLRSSGHKLPIVALTAYAMKGDREKALDAGCNEYLPKPLPINKLVELLKKYQANTKQQPKPAVAAANSKPRGYVKPTVTHTNDANQPTKAATPTKDKDNEPVQKASNQTKSSQQNDTEVKPNPQPKQDSSQKEKQDNLSA